MAVIVFLFLTLAAPAGRAGEALPVPLMVAVLDLGGSGNSGDATGRLISEMLTTALASRKPFRLVERKRLEDVLGEMEFGSGSVSGLVANKIGSMAGADAMVTGSVADIGGTLRIDIRLVAIRDGAVLAVASAQSGKDARGLTRAVEGMADSLAAALVNSDGPPFMFTLLAMSGDGALRSVAANGVIRSGEHYKVAFTPDRDCYVYIFQMDAAGQFFQLFPMESFGGVQVGQANPARKGERYLLPALDKAFVLDRQTGKERIFCVVSDGPNERLESLYAEVLAARRDRATAAERKSRTQFGHELATRGLAAVVEDKPAPVAWESGGEVFTVVSRRLASACRDCAHVIEFRHK